MAALTMQSVVGYETLYSVTESGEIWAHPKKRMGAYGSCRNCSGRWLQPGKNKNGYLLVSLWKDGKGKTWQLHRIVALAFLENPNNFPHINHKNRDRTDNRVVNLEWCTPQQNIIHSFSFGDRKFTEKQKIASSKNAKKTRKFSIEVAEQIFYRYKSGGISMRKLAMEYGFSCSGVNDIVNGKTYPEIYRNART